MYIPLHCTVLYAIADAGCESFLVVPVSDTDFESTADGPSCPNIRRDPTDAAFSISRYELEVDVSPLTLPPRRRIRRLPYRFPSLRQYLVPFAAVPEAFAKATPRLELAASVRSTTRTMSRFSRHGGPLPVDPTH
jgi:hypothetical protein